jgi:hypothetical protein
MDDGRGWFRTSDLSRAKRDLGVQVVSIVVTGGLRETQRELG